MEGSTTITPAADKNDVYLENGKMITVDDTLSPQGGTAARITPAAYAPTTKVLDGSKVGTEHIKFTVTPNGSEHWIVGNSGTLLNFGAISLDEIKSARIFYESLSDYKP